MRVAAAYGSAALAVALGAMLCTVRRRIAVVTVAGESMEPVFRQGDRVLVLRARLPRLRRGQVVVLEKPGPEGTWSTPPPRWPGRYRTWMIKRIAAVPGDPMPDLAHPLTGVPAPRSSPPGGRVPAGMFVALGDNPRGSLDSRIFGCCPADRLLGVVVACLPP